MATRIADARALLSVNDLISVRISDHATEYASRVEDVDDDSVTVAAPMGAAASLLESGTRTVEMAWMCPRGRYEQQGELIEYIGQPLKQWRIRPTGEANLQQRRRFVRVVAILPALVVLEDEEFGGTTIDIAEGGLRLLINHDPIEADTPVTVHLTIDEQDLAIEASVLRCTPRPTGGVQMVVTFPAEGWVSDVLRRFVFLTQLKERARVRSGGL